MDVKTRIDAVVGLLKAADALCQKIDGKGRLDLYFHFDGGTNTIAVFDVDYFWSICTALEQMPYIQELKERGYEISTHEAYINYQNVKISMFLNKKETKQLQELCDVWTEETWKRMEEGDAEEEDDDGSDDE